MLYSETIIYIININCDFTQKGDDVMSKATGNTMKRMVLTIALAVVLAITALPAGAHRVFAAAAKAKIEYLAPPTTVQWLDEDNLILGISPVDGAEWYDIEYDIKASYPDIEDYSAFPRSDYETPFRVTHDIEYLWKSQTRPDLYQVNVKQDLQNEEVQRGFPFTGNVTIKVRAGKGFITNYPDMTSTIDAVSSKNISTAKYTTCLDKSAAKKPVLADAQLTNDNNKLVISLKDNASAIQARIDYRVYFSVNGKPIHNYSCLYDLGANYYQYDGLAYDESQDGDPARIEIPVKYFVRNEMEEQNGLSDGDSLTVTLQGWSIYNDANGNAKFNVSKPITSNAITYQKASVTDVKIDQNAYNQGTTQTISAADTKKLFPNSSDGSTLDLKVQSTDPDSSAELKDLQTNFNIISAFNVDLKYSGTGNAVKQPDTTLRITVPIPANMKDKKIKIIEYGYGPFMEVGSKNNGDGTVSLYSDFGLLGYDFAGKYAVVLSDDESVDDNTTPDTDDSAFTDIKKSDYCYDAVNWAKENGITDGLTETTFGPGNTVKRGQMITFVYRYYENLTKQGTDKYGINQSYTTAFTDVSETAYYRKAVEWAAGNDITSGTSDTTFSPEDPVTRAQMVTFLYRAAKKFGNATIKGDSSFSDVKDGYFADAVKWAAGYDVTNGTGDGIFSPGSSCLRAQGVTFIYRADGQKLLAS